MNADVRRSVNEDSDFRVELTAYVRYVHVSVCEVCKEGQDKTGTGGREVVRKGRKGVLANILHALLNTHSCTGE